MNSTSASKPAPSSAPDATQSRRGLAFQHPYPLAAVSAVVALGIFPLGLGHTLYNAAVRHVHATYANLIATQEGTAGVIVGVILLREIPSITAIIGGIVTLVGIIGVLI